MLVLWQVDGCSPSYDDVINNSNNNDIVAERVAVIYTDIMQVQLCTFRTK